MVQNIGMEMWLIVYHINQPALLCLPLWHSQGGKEWWIDGKYNIQNTDSNSDSATKLKQRRHLTSSHSYIQITNMPRG